MIYRSSNDLTLFGVGVKEDRYAELVEVGAHDDRAHREHMVNAKGLDINHAWIS